MVKIFYLLLHHVEAEADQGWEEVLNVDAGLPHAGLVLLEHHRHGLQLALGELGLARHLENWGKENYNSLGRGFQKGNGGES